MEERDVVLGGGLSYPVEWYGARFRVYGLGFGRVAHPKHYSAPDCNGRVSLWCGILIRRDDGF